MGANYGVLADADLEGSITASYATGTVSGESYVGGLVGANSGGSITTSYATGTVSAESVVGGLVGHNQIGPITSSYATGAVSGESYVGGLVGDNAGTITASYATGQVSGTSDVIAHVGTGGLVGNNAGTITASYATGTVSAEYSVGGLVGYNPGAITASYATGRVSGGDSIGGLVGSNFGSGGTATASYWDTQTSGLSSSAGGEGKMTSELQSPTSNTGIYATWDDDVWDFGTSSQYPALKDLHISVAEQRQSHPAAVSSPGAPTIGAVAPRTGSLAVSWTAPSSDGGSAITAYDLRHIEDLSRRDGRLQLDRGGRCVDHGWREAPVHPHRTHCRHAVRRPDSGCERRGRRALVCDRNRNASGARRLRHRRRGGRCDEHRTRVRLRCAACGA